MRLLPLLGVAAIALGGCGGGSGASTSPAKVVAALDMKKVRGLYAIDGNPFCSVSRILTDGEEVKAASSSGLVIASRNGTVGVKIVKPFAPSCSAKAQRKLNRLAGVRRHHRRKAAKSKARGGGKNKGGSSKKGGSNGGKA